MRTVLKLVSDYFTTEYKFGYEEYKTENFTPPPPDKKSYSINPSLKIENLDI